MPVNGTPNNGGSLNSRFRIGRARRGVEALELRLAGHSFAEIGRRMGVSGARAFALVRGELDRLNAQRSEDATELRAIEEARLDKLLSAVWDAALAGDLKAVSTALAILQRRARLLGLDLEPDMLPREEVRRLAGELAEMVSSAVREEVHDPGTLRRIRDRLSEIIGVGVVVEADPPPEPAAAAGNGQAGNGQVVPYGLRELPPGGDNDPEAEGDDVRPLF
jgi:hypothetical protein